MFKEGLRHRNFFAGAFWLARDCDPLIVELCAEACIALLD
jgi:hypothetical protein